ncbi:lipid-A-disaccharide synthase [Aridibaculum aurantiacum]|uniref:lipid-A-disaccharide synthase n=1 Tax=Aridibaculum aurantiacum TaxID=2810307 RepID=UPI001A9738B7|nr:lipid-A-disaccharide synthase [Aridibaculum aurantiacum]
MKYYIIAGEASGDLHGSNLIKHLHQLDNSADIRCWGGDMMQQQGATLVKHYRDLAFMGFVEVLMNLRTIFRNIDFCKQDIAAYKPDVVIFIDYPGFNIRLAKWAKQQGYKTIYYISPQVWAWKENRVKTIKAYVDKMLVILPFEKDFYSKWDYKVEYVGHPLVEVIEEYKRTANTKPDDQQGTRNQEPPSITPPIIALLPGSRKQEINVKLPIMLEVSKAFPQYHFIVAKAPGMDDEFYQPFLAPFANVSAVGGKTYDLLNRSTAALVTSGTATLETALFGVPEVVCYKGNKISFAIAKRIVKIKYISLVNLIMDKQVVKELIQDDLTTENCIKELKDLLENPARQKHLQKDYADLKALLSQGGHASSNAAKVIMEFMEE